MRKTPLPTGGAIDVDALIAFHRTVFGDARMENDPAPAGDPAPSGDPAPAGDPAPTPSPTPTPPPTGQPEWDGKIESLPEAAQKMIRDLRAENADKRTKATAAEKAQQDAIRALAKAAGIEIPGDDEGQPDPAALAQQLARAQDDGRSTKVELEVFKAAAAAGANPLALTDSRSFMTKVAALDPTADDFAAKVTDAIKAHLDANPTARATPVVTSSSADHAGGSGESAVTKAQFDAMSYQERAALYQKDPDTYRRLNGD